jgi:ribosomal protein S18 acetylase RimI-like enzyme
MDWSYTEKQVEDWYVGKMPTWDWGMVGCVGESLVGFIATQVGHIDQLFIEPDQQRCGIGTALMRTALARISGRATLHVFAENENARTFYERFGFRGEREWWNEHDGAVELLYVLDQCREAP